ncbi:hypothetical protein [Candidatus Methylomirabilis limnetica]|uniref:hypothetical protein n=1 Tax=Candidatus Methylomirabilis limnetica TaxID=2033718 RepID=UPI001056E481|nr:hypothetical protein [Candidatus Methylomirabilis limnetica]
MNRTRCRLDRCGATLPGICDGGDGVDSTNAGRCTAAVAIATLGPIPAARPYFVVSVGCTGVERPKRP